MQLRCIDHLLHDVSLLRSRQCVCCPGTLEVDLTHRLQAHCPLPIAHCPLLSAHVLADDSTVQEFTGTVVMMVSMQLLEKRGAGLSQDGLILWHTLKALYSAFIIVVLILGLGGPTGKQSESVCEKLQVSCQCPRSLGLTPSDFLLVLAVQEGK